MIWVLRLGFALVLVSMLAITSWAGAQCSLFAIPSDVLRHPWFLATLADAYWAFLTVYLLIAWKERAWPARILWFVAVVLLGNLATAAYFLRESFSLKTAAEIGDWLPRRNPGALPLPACLTVAGVIVYWLA